MKTGEIYILDEIGGQFITARAIIEQLKKFDDEKVDEIKVFINSPGGSVFEGLTIYNQLAARKNVTTIIEGLAASMASVIALAGKKVLMRPSSLMLVHNPWTIAIVDTEEIHKLGDDMNKIKNSITKIYVDKTGLKDDEVKALMNENRFMDADEALKKGFVDEIVKAQDAKNYVRSFVALGSGIKDDTKKIEENKMLKSYTEFLLKLGFTKEEIEKGVTEDQYKAKTDALKKELKLEDNATAFEIVKALDAKANPQSKKEDPGTDDLKTAVEKLTAKVDGLQTDLKDSKEKGVRSKAEELVNKAIEDYKILPTQKDTYVAAAILDLVKVEAELAKIPKGTVKPAKLKTPPSKETSDIDFEDKESIQKGIRAIMKEYTDAGKSCDQAKALAILKQRNGR